MIEPGQIIDGKYRIVRELGAGGMGAVYEGENVRIGRRVAIKVLHAEAAHAPDLRRRFEREARVAAKIGSPNICDVLDLGDLPSGHAYLVMEYLEGEGLDSLLTRVERLPAKEIAPIVVQLLDGLSAMHGANIVHRDLKPANVFLTDSGGRELVKILDFGISKFQAQTEDLQKTETGALLGTPLYMSPEQSRGLELDGRSDIYSVGVILYRALSGGHCFDADNLPQLLFKTALEAPIPLEPRVDGVDRSFVPIVEKALEKDPANRYASAREFRDAIADWMTERYPEVPLAPPPARFEGVLEASGARPQFDARRRTGPSIQSGEHAAAVIPHTPITGGSGGSSSSSSSGSKKISPAAASVDPSAEPKSHEDTANSWEAGGSFRSVEAVDVNARTTASQPPPAPASKSKMGLYVAVAAAMLVVGSGGAFVLKSRGGETSHGGPKEPSALEAHSSAPTSASVTTPPVSDHASASAATPSTAAPAAIESAQAATSATAASTTTTPSTTTSLKASVGGNGGSGSKSTATTATTAKNATAASPDKPADKPPPADPTNKPGRKIRTDI